MNRHLNHEELNAGHAMGPHIIIDTSEIEPGRFETMAVNQATGDELAVNTAATREDADVAFRAMVIDMAERFDHPLQAAFYRGNMIPGNKYTLAYIGEFGFPVSVRITYHCATLSTYAQYGDAVKITYTLARARTQRVKYLYGESFMVYDGWRELDQSVTFESKGVSNGFSVTASKYASFDERYIDDIKAVWPDYIIAYDHNRVRRDGVSYEDGQELQAEDFGDKLTKPYTIARGVTVLHDAEGCDGVSVDVSPELFAALFASAPEYHPDDGQRLANALLRAAIASAKEIDHDDGGTCNFDSPAMDYKACGFTKARAAEIIKSVGLSSFEWKTGSALVIGGFQCGQGYRHTAMARAFSDSMNAQGYACGMYYQMD